MSIERKIWTFGEMDDKVRLDTDLLEEDPDEEIVGVDEMVGYFNDALDVAEAKIHLIDEDYFLMRSYLDSYAGEDEYDLPFEVYANKIRGFFYKSGSLIYPIKKFNRYKKFEELMNEEQYGTTLRYRYYINNPSSSGEKLILVPAAAETSVVPPQANQSTPFHIWHLRNANRIPITGEYTNRKSILPTAVDAGADTITVSDSDVAYANGNKVKFSVPANGVLPAPLVAGTVYFIVGATSTTIQVSATLGGSAINLTDTGTKFFYMQRAATRAMIDATPIDIPEFPNFIMQHVKVAILLKDGDPRVVKAEAELEKQEQLMVSVLTNRQPDDDDVHAMDLSAYEEHS